jgi:serine/threonine protein kinase
VSSGWGRELWPVLSLPVPRGATGAVPRFGRYEPLALIGRGPTGVVYRAYDPLQRRLVAVKAVKPEIAGVPEELERYRHKTRAAARLEHPHVVGVYEVGPDYVARQMAPRGTLATLSAARGALSPREAADILAPVAAALDHAHARGVVHGDVRPETLRIEPGSRATITDFGIGHLETALSLATGRVPLRAYRSPEQVSRGLAGPASDIYALGAVAFELITLRQPFQATSLHALLRSIVHDAPASPRSARHALSLEAEAALLQALAKDPGDRFPTARSFVEALRDS